MTHELKSLLEPHGIVVYRDDSVKQVVQSIREVIVKGLVTRGGAASSRSDDSGLERLLHELLIDEPTAYSEFLKAVSMAPEVLALPNLPFRESHMCTRQC